MLKNNKCDKITCNLHQVGFTDQITLGMNYLHTLSPPVVHGDLKIANVLVDDGCIMKVAHCARICVWVLFALKN